MNRSTIGPAEAIMAKTLQQAAGTMGPMPPLVGRTAERVLLSEQLSAITAGHGNVVIIGGEAGIGKTTIARDVAAHAQEMGHATLAGHCYDLMAAPPYGLWLDLAERYRHGSTSSDTPPLPHPLASRNLDTITTQSAFYADVIAFLAAITAEQPVVIVLEDVHWADPASLELLRHISAHIAHMPLLLIVTYREDELTRQNPFYQQLPSLVRQSEGLRLDLKQFNAHDLETLVSLHYALPDADRARLVTYLANHAEGNPFFTMELLRSLEDQDCGGLVGSGETWTLDALDRTMVPPLVRQVIDARVARLGESTRTPLTISAVIGHEVSLDLLASISDMPAEALYSVIDKAIEWHLLMATPDGSGIQFVHALTREALYTSIPPHRRRLLHTAIAEALEAMPGADPDDIAYHYQQAGDARAPEWLTRAGDRAQRAYAWLTAKDRFATAARLLEHIPGAELTRARLLSRCGRLQRYSNAAAAIESLHTASRLAEIAGDTVLGADATYLQGVVQCFADAWKPGLADMIRGVQILESLPLDQAYVSWTTATWMADALPSVEATSPSADVRADSLTAIGPNRNGGLLWFLAAAGRLGEAHALAESFRELPKTDTGPLALANTGHAEFGRGILLAARGDPDGARDSLDNARDTYLQLDHHAVLAFVYVTNLLDAMIPYHTEDVAGRRRLADQAELTIDRARGALATEISPDRAQLPIMYLDGHWNKARTMTKTCQVHGTYALRRPVTLVLAAIAYHRGDTGEAWRQILALLSKGPDSEPGSAVLLDALMLQRLAVHLCLDANDRDSADLWLRANDRWLTWSGSVLGRAENHLAWAECHQAIGDTTAAVERADQAIKAATAPSQPLALLIARRIRGELAREENDLVTAEQHLTASLSLATTCEIPFERARSLLALARLRTTTDHDAASLMANEALEICRSLNAHLLIGQIEQFLSDISGVLSKVDFPGRLTDRELDVLRLVAQGMTDAEVGAVLSISPRTVSQHLRSIYSKLTVRSRLEATRYAMDYGLI